MFSFKSLYKNTQRSLYLITPLLLTACENLVKLKRSIVYAAIVRLALSCKVTVIFFVIKPYNNTQFARVHNMNNTRFFMLDNND